MARVIAGLSSVGRWLLLGVVALAGDALGTPLPVHAQAGRSETALFRAEIDPDLVPRGGWAVHGYIYSDHDYRVGGVRLRCDVLDASGEVVSHSFGWVVGDVPPRGRAYFYVHVPVRGASYRVTVLSFYPIARGAP